MQSSSACDHRMPALHYSSSSRRAADTSTGPRDGLIDEGTDYGRPTDGLGPTDVWRRCLSLIGGRQVACWRSTPSFDDRRLIASR